ncbi:MAG: hypothetical protein HY695_02270 [Deltaproteobacteria bacterium]|nr:hypothetical protein [Deltaproteobacteria bacterium]
MIRQFEIWVVMSLVFLAGACDLSTRLSAIKIKDLLENPRKYENREVTIYGTVTGGASLLVVKYFEIEDGTGAMRVVTSRVLPGKGEKIKVIGTLESIEFGTERMVVLREKSEKEG